MQKPKKTPNSVLDSTPETQVIFDTLRRIVQALRRSSTRLEASAGLSASQAFLLQSLQQKPGASVGELANLLHASQSTVSDAVARLIERGLVLRVPASQDRRRVELSLSPKGQDLLGLALPLPQQQLIAGLSKLAPEQRQQLATNLQAWLLAAGMAQAHAPLFFEDASEPQA